MKTINFSFTFSPKKIAVLLAIPVIAGAAYLGVMHQVDKPFESIKTYKPDHDYGQAYWTKEKNADSNLWEEAITYCNTYQTPTPGCLEVEGAYTGIDMSKLPNTPISF